MLLTRYADLLKDWMIDERQHVRVVTPWMPMVDDRYGIIAPPMLDNWERQSMPLRVSGAYPRLFTEFLSYFLRETDILKDYSLSKEADIIRQLCYRIQPSEWDYPVR